MSSLASLDLETTAQQMIAAALAALGEQSRIAQNFAKRELKVLAQTVAYIQSESLAGRLSSEEAFLLLEMQKNALRSVLLTVEGLGKLAVERALNAALGVVRVAVNTAVGAVLL